MNNMANKKKTRNGSKLRHKHAQIRKALEHTERQRRLSSPAYRKKLKALLETVPPFPSVDSLATITATLLQKQKSIREQVNCAIGIWTLCRLTIETEIKADIEYGEFLDDIEKAAAETESSLGKLKPGTFPFDEMIDSYPVNFDYALRRIVRGNDIIGKKYYLFRRFLRHLCSETMTESKKKPSDSIIERRADKMFAKLKSKGFSRQEFESTFWDFNAWRREALLRVKISNLKGKPKSPDKQG